MFTRQAAWNKFKNCKEILADSSIPGKKNSCENCLEKIIGLNTKATQAICHLQAAEKDDSDNNYFNTICSDLIHTTLGLQNADQRR